MSRPAIRVRDLCHRYAGKDVLTDVSFDVAEGEIFGFIGPNGAGKSTTIRVLATMLEPSYGRVEVLGHDVLVEPEKVRRLIGYMPDHAGVYERLTVREYLTFFASAYALEDPGIVDTVMELTDLGQLADRIVPGMSKGMKQRLSLARILLHDPKVLILDEPASDLDPRARIELRDLLLELRSLGKTIFLSSHILTELADICTSVAILERGRLVVAGGIDEIAARFRGAREAPDQAALGAPETTTGGAPITQRTKHRVRVRILGDAHRVVNLVTGGPGVVRVEVTSPSSVSVTYVGGEQFIADMVRHLVLQSIQIAAVEPERSDLEQIFLEATRGELQ